MEMIKWRVQKFQQQMMPKNDNWIWWLHIYKIQSLQNFAQTL